MKKYNNIDELFKEELSGFEIIPGNSVWKGIRKKIFRNDNYWYLLLILTFISIGVPSYLHFTDEEPVKNSEILTQSSASERFDIVDENISQSIIIINDTNELTKNETYNITKENTSDTSQLVEAINNENMKPVFGSNVYSMSTYELSESHKLRQDISRLNNKQRYSIYQNYPDSIKNRDRTVSVEEYIIKKKKFHAYTGISASAGIMYFKDTPDMFTWSVDMGVGYKFNKFYIETGIGHERVDQHGDYRIDYETRDSVGYYNEVVSFEINPNNTDEIYYNTRETTVYDSVSHYRLTNPVYNYSYINIPIWIGYRFFEREKFSASIQTGVTFSFLNNVNTPKVEFYNPDAKLLSINNHTPERSQNNIKFNIGLRLNYKVHRSISIGIQPEFYHYLNSVFNESSGRNLLPYSIKVRAGIYFNF